MLRHDVFCMMELLDGPGLQENKMSALESSEWEPEAEDVLMWAGVWHPKTHSIQGEKITTESMAAVKKEIAR